MDMVSIYFIPLGAFLAAVLFYWICGDTFVKEEIQKGRKAAFPRFLLLMGNMYFAESVSSFLFWEFCITELVREKKELQRNSSFFYEL
ncbi:Uncharacterised protein [Fusobacterium necrophorum subsp. necrophorum]|nr:Uncharacterised protein [Fusobacterium necrophorum subsp. necrophorum]